MNGIGGRVFSLLVWLLKGERVGEDWIRRGFSGELCSLDAIICFGDGLLFAEGNS